MMLRYLVWRAVFSIVDFAMLCVGKSGKLAKSSEGIVSVY